jgi:hypothetical protein
MVSSPKAFGHVVVQPGFDIAADQSRGKFAEGAAEKIFHQIDGDGVHAHPHEWLTPLLIFPHVHHEIKRPEQQR